MAEVVEQSRTTEKLAGDEFVFTDEQKQLRAAVRGFCAEHLGERAVRAAMESDPPYDARV